MTTKARIQPLEQLELPVFAFAAPALHGLVLHQLVFDVAQERRWFQRVRAAAPMALARAAEDQPVLGPGHADIEQTTLFRHRRVVRLAPMQRQQAVLEPDDTATAEERRLFYVGMTRAKDRLILSRARHRHWRGRPHTLEPSPFLRDIEHELVKHQPMQGARAKREDRQLKLF